jgi:protein O-mannosyl-transferase
MSRRKSRRRDGRDASPAARAADARSRATSRAAEPAAVVVPAELAAALAVAVVTLVAYASASAGVIVHDDRFFYPSHAHSLLDFFRKDVWGAATGSSIGGLYRPLLLLSLALDTALFGGSGLAAHRVNIALHVTATLALYAFALALVRTRFREATAPFVAPLAAGVAATVFGVHPIHTEAVDSIFNRSELLVTICVLGALGAIWRWEEQHRLRAWSAAAVLYLAALFSRESAVSLPALAVLLLVLLRPESGTRRIAWVLVLLVPLAAYLALRHAALAAMPETSVPPLTEIAAPEGVADRMGIVVASFGEYLRMVAWPHPLRLSYEDFAGGEVLLAIVVNGALVLLAVLCRRRAPIVAFGIASFYVALAPSTRLFTDPGFALSLGGHVLFRPDPGLTPLAERVVYLPSAGLAIALAAGLAALARRYGLPAVLAVGVAVTAVFVPLTNARNLEWRSARALIDAEVRAAPGNGDAWRMYVGVLLDEGRHAEIADVCDRHAAEHPRSAQLQNSCGAAYAQLGRLDDAVVVYRRAIDAGLTTSGRANLGRTYARMGRAEDAEREFQLAADAEKDPALRHYRLGQLIERFHPDRLDDAATEYRRVLELRPDYAPAAEALRRIGRR